MWKNVMLRALSGVTNVSRAVITFHRTAEVAEVRGTTRARILSFFVLLFYVLLLSERRAGSCARSQRSRSLLFPRRFPSDCSPFHACSRALLRALQGFRTISVPRLNSFDRKGVSLAAVVCVLPLARAHVPILS